MIKVYYYFYNKTEKKMKYAEQMFENVDTAIRFCWSMKRKKMILDGWLCYDPEDNLLMHRKVNIAKINGWSI